MARAFVLASLASLAVLCGCGAPRWDGHLSTWGSMRAVMGEGRTEGRVDLDAAVRSRSAVGLGALEGLRGEIAIVDGEAWVARVENGRLERGRRARPGDRATLLAVADVPAWTTVPIGQDLTSEDLDALLARVAVEHRLPPGGPWPFVIEGEFAGVEAHVLNGECPYAGAVSPEHEPFRLRLDAVDGMLVGFYAPEAAGTLVHHGQATHAHLLIERPDAYVGHVDRVSVLAGARLRVPAR